MPLVATRGAASAQGFGEFAQAAAPVYIEDVFSTYLYTGTGSAQTITNNIDLSTKGGLVWIKDRTNAYNHNLFDTAQGTTKLLHSNTTDATATDANSLTAFGTTGFTLGTGNTAGNQVNTNTDNFVSWTFRKQPKFFDVVTYTGNGQVSAQNIAHNLGSVPGMIIVKRTDMAANWAVYHRSMGATKFMRLNITNGEATSSDYWNNTEPTSTHFTVGIGGAVNDSGTYVAYLFAHNAGGFGASGSDNVISCGSFTTDANGEATVTLDWEPQWVLLKGASTSYTTNWNILDSMRGMPVSGNQNQLRPNTADAEISAANASAFPNATGFKAYAVGGATLSGHTFIYIAIRRGPMKTPTSGTSVYGPVSYTGNNASNRNIQTGFPIDWYMFRNGTDNVTNTYSSSRLQGSGTYMFTNTTASQASIGITYFNLAQQNGIVPSTTTADFNTSGVPYMLWGFRRAPGFLDVVCYTGNGNASQLETHNLGVAPELYICKRRNGTSSWEVWSKTPGVDAVYTLALQSTGAGLVNSAYNGYATTTTIEVGGQVASNTSTATYVAYLFSSVAGVSKVGRYTGTGTTQQINCGFTNGSRFVLIKRTDSTGDWYVWDSARGIVAGDDPYLLLNSTAAEVTNTDYVDTYNAGFELSSTAPAAINANGGSYIFLAIA